MMLPNARRTLFRRCSTRCFQLKGQRHGPLLKSANYSTDNQRYINIDKSPEIIDAEAMKDMQDQEKKRTRKIKRTYQKVAVAYDPEPLGSDYPILGDTSNKTSEEIPAWGVTLDNSKLRTPVGRPLKVPSEQLALLLANEWNAQEEFVRPENMPMMQLVSTTLDRLIYRDIELHAALKKHIANYITSDDVSFRVPEDDDPELLRKQEIILNPIVEWFSQEFGVTLLANYSMVPVEQDERTVAKIDSILDACSAWELGAMDSLSTTTRSVILPIAVLKGAVTAEEAASISRIEENHQIASWGSAEGAHDVDSIFVWQKIAAAACLLDSLPLVHRAVKPKLKYRINLEGDEAANNILIRM